MSRVQIEPGLSGEETLRRKFATPDVVVDSRMSEDVARYLEGFDSFFIATSNRAGECDASYRGKGQTVPALKVLDEQTMIFPDYLGNGSFRSLGNILENPHIGMLFIDTRTGVRMRVNGDAEITDDDEWLKLFPGSLQIVRVVVREIYKQNQPARKRPQESRA